MPAIVNSPSRYLLVAQILSDEADLTVRTISERAGLPLNVISPNISNWALTEHLEMTKKSQGSPGVCSLTSKGKEVLELIKNGTHDLTEAQLKKRGWKKLSGYVSKNPKRPKNTDNPLPKGVMVAQPAPSSTPKDPIVSSSEPPVCTPEEVPGETFSEKTRESLHTDSLNLLIDALAFKIAESVMEKVFLNLENMLSDSNLSISDLSVKRFISGIEKSIPDDEKGKPKILVVGLLPAQKNLIQKEFSQDLDVRFAESNVTHKVLRQKMQGCEKTFVLTNFISHALDGVIASSGVSYERLTGGMSTLRETLKNYCMLKVTEN